MTRVALTCAFLLACATGAFADGVKDEPIGEHPRLPSQPRLGADLIYEQGAPQGRDSSHDPQAIARGRALYDTHCITCHGADLNGSPGVPSLQKDGGAAVDFYVGTGRMPDAMKSLQAVHSNPHFTNEQIDALDAYVTSRAGSDWPVPAVATNDAMIPHGRKLFEENCQACHGAAGEGASAGGEWVALPLYSATANQVSEAIRIGPGVMPRFTQAQLSEKDVAALASYVRYLTIEAPAYGGFTMDYAGPAAEGLVGGLLGVGGLFWVIYFTGTKADGTRLSDD